MSFWCAGSLAALTLINHCHHCTCGVPRVTVLRMLYLCLVLCADKNLALAGEAGAIDAMVAIMRAHIDDHYLSAMTSNEIRILCENGIALILIAFSV